MSMTRRTSSTISMTRALARSSSVSLVLPLASPQQKASILYTLRRAQSSIPAVECCVVSSEYPANQINNEDNNNNNNGTANNGTVEGYRHQRLEAGGVNEYLEDSYGSGDFGSCNSSIADLFDVLEEPQRVSKDILRSLSISFQWLDLPFQELDLPTCFVDTSDVAPEQRLVTDTADAADTADTAEDGMLVTTAATTAGGEGGLASGKQWVLRFAYIYECGTGRSLVSHAEVRTAMDGLQHWKMQGPKNCCLSYKHDVTGVVATLPWPDLEAGSLEEIEEFVSTVNGVEGKPVFFSRYQRMYLDSVECQRSLSSFHSLSPTAIQE